MARKPDFPSHLHLCRALDSRSSGERFRRGHFGLGLEIIGIESDRCYIPSGQEATGDIHPSRVSQRRSKLSSLASIRREDMELKEFIERDSAYDLMLRSPSLG